MSQSQQGSNISLKGRTHDRSIEYLHTTILNKMEIHVDTVFVFILNMVMEKIKGITRCF